MDLMTQLANGELALPLLRPYANRLLGTKTELAEVEVLHAWRKTWAKPRREPRDFLRIYARLQGINADGRAIERRIQGVAVGAADHDAARQLPHRIDWGNVALSYDFLPHDAALPALVKVLSRRACAYSAPAATRERLAGPPDTVELVSYRPGQRAVVRVSRGAVSVFAKLFADRQHESLATRLPALREALQRRTNKNNSTSLELPQLLGHEPSDGAVWLSAVSGRAASDLLVDPATAAESRGRIGAALADWHRLEAPDGLPVVARQQSLIEAQRKLRKLRHEDPASVQVIDALEQRWESMFSRLAASRPTLLHGDVHPDQFLLGCHGQVGICDLDEIALGDVERDLAQGQERLDCDDFLRAWRERSGRDFDATLFRWYLSIAYVDRAYRELTARGRLALPALAQRLRRAVECLP